MLEQARAKAARAGFAERMSFALGDLDDRPTPFTGSAPFDLAICFHNVIGFVADPGATVAAIAAALRPGGQLALMAPNRLHAAYVNLTQGELDEAERCMDGEGRFASDMPYIELFTPDSVEAIFDAADLRLEDMVGFPSLVYPGFKETRLTGSSRLAASILDDPVSFERVEALERRAMEIPGISSRGNNLLAVGMKAEG